MKELYNLIEQKIKASGYPRPINGADVYNDICDQIDGKAAKYRYFFFHFVPSKAGFSFMIKQLRRLVNAFSFAA